MHESVSNESLDIPENRSPTSMSTALTECPIYELALIEELEEMLEPYDSDSIPELESTDSSSSNLSVPEINLNEGNEEIILADLPPSLIEIDNAECSLRSLLEQGCCSEDRADGDVHDISCEVVNFNDYPLGWNKPHWSPYNPLKTGPDMSAAEYQAIEAEGIRQEIERAVP